MDQRRREFLKWGAFALAANLAPISALAEAVGRKGGEKFLSFYNTHTDEIVDTCFFKSGDYCAGGLTKISRILRDHRTNEAHPIDLELLETLYAAQRKVGPGLRFHIISGYRSPSTNAMLRETTSGVAQTSYHTQGRAIDVRLPGCSTRRLRDACISMQSGGVGYYPASNFVHLDTGPVRRW